MLFLTSSDIFGDNGRCRLSGCIFPSLVNFRDGQCRLSGLTFIFPVDESIYRWKLNFSKRLLDLPQVRVCVIYAYMW